MVTGRSSPGGWGRSFLTLALILSALRLRLFGTRDEFAAADRIRLRIERLGGVWIKLGQTLALRRDLLPPSYCEHFMRLLDAVPPISAAEARATIEREFQRPVEELFDSFDDAPIASASIGQVHLAWRRGKNFAVKVQRRDAPALFAADFAMLRGFARFGDLLGLGSGLSLVSLLAEFEATTRRELDYREEAFSARLLARNAGDSPRERHVQSDPARSGARVLTMAYAYGRSLRVLMQGPADFGGIDRGRLAEHLLWNTLNQIYRFGVFHADPHPANLFIDAEGGITYVDHGQVGQLGDEERMRLSRFAWSMAEERFDEAAAQMLEIARPTDHTDLAAVRRESRAAIARHIRMMRGPAIDRIAAGPFDRLMMDIARRHRLAVPPEFALYLKTISMVDAVLRNLSPTLDSYGLQYRFFARAAAQEAREALHPARLLSTVSRLSIAVEEGLALLSRLDDTADSADVIVRGVRRRLTGLNLLILLGVAGAAPLAVAILNRHSSLFGVPVLPVLLGCIVLVTVASLGLFGQTFQLRRADRALAKRRQRRAVAMPKNE
ncbi:hypothetical protein BH10PSE12_BH10PSE12_15600 [soil metagenome]